MVLPFNTFTIHNIIGFMVTGSLAVVFYLVYFGMGRRLLDLLSANFIACTAVMCLASVITDNLVPAGMPARGWPGGPTAGQLAFTTLEAHRWLWAAGLLTIPTKLHFALHFCSRRNWLLRNIRWVYVVAILTIPTVWTSVWLAAPEQPADWTSSWNVAIPWMPITGWPLLPFTLAWYGVTGYSVWLLYKTRRSPGNPRSEYEDQRRPVFWAFAAQMGICTLDLVFIVIGYDGISLIPVGGTIMGILLAYALIRARISSYESRIRLQSEKAALMESVPQPLVYFDRDFGVQWANSAAARSAGVQDAESELAAITAIWAPPASPQRQVVEQALAEGRVCQREVVRGDATTWLVHASPVTGAGEKILGAVMLAMDITRIRWAEETLRTASTRILTAREHERRRLAADLHDSLAQSLATLKLALDVAAGACAPASQEHTMLTASSDQCRQLVQEVRHICHNLYPPSLDSLGLTTAIRRVFRDISRSGIDCQLHCSPQVDGMRFPPHVEIALFRVVQEATNNAIRHGGAGRIDVYLELADDESVHLRVVDDGTGFDPEDQTRHGLGMHTMKSRIDGIGGRLDIRSQPGRTRVEACVQYKNGNGKPGETTGEFFLDGESYGDGTTEQPSDTGGTTDQAEGGD